MTDYEYYQRQEAVGERQLQPWIPMSDPHDLAAIGKLLEELGELQAILARCLIQGIDKSDPKTGKPNKQAVEEELADVLATSSKCADQFALDRNRMNERIGFKVKWLADWHNLITETLAPKPERKKPGFWSALFGDADDAPPLP